MSGPSPVEPPQTVAASSAFSYSTILKAKTNESDDSALDLAPVSASASASDPTPVPAPAPTLVPDAPVTVPDPTIQSGAVIERGSNEGCEEPEFAVTPPHRTILSTMLPELDAIFDEVEAKMALEEFTAPARSPADLKVYDVISTVDENDWKILVDAVDPASCSSKKEDARRTQFEEAANALSKKDLKQLILKKAPKTWIEGTDVKQRRRSKRQLVALMVAIDLGDDALFRREVANEVGLDEFIGADGASSVSVVPDAGQAVAEVAVVEEGWTASTNRTRLVEAQQVSADVGGVNRFDSGMALDDNDEEEEEVEEPEQQKKKKKKKRKAKKSAVATEDAVAAEDEFISPSSHPKDAALSPTDIASSGSSQPATESSSSAVSRPKSKKTKKGKGRAKNRNRGPIPTDLDDFDELVLPVQQSSSSPNVLMMASIILLVALFVTYWYGLRSPL